jgi:hypothetical protein
MSPEFIKIMKEAQRCENMPSNILPEEAYRLGKRLFAEVFEKSKGLTLKADNTTPEENKARLYDIMTAEACQAMKLGGFHSMLDDYYDTEAITKLYIQHTGFSDPKSLALADKGKYSYNASESAKEFYNPSPYQVLHPTQGNK